MIAETKASKKIASHSYDDHSGEAADVDFDNRNSKAKFFFRYMRAKERQQTVNSGCLNNESNRTFVYIVKMSVLIFLCVLALSFIPSFALCAIPLVAYSRYFTHILKYLPIGC